MTPGIDATVVITTKNRRDDLHAAIDSALAQTGAAVEVLVIDDGSTDGTAELVRRKFPTVVLHRAEQSQGYIVQRNAAAKLARAPIIFSIDDDAAFSTPHIVAQTLALFTDARIGAVAIPFIDVNKNPEIHQLAPDDKSIWITSTYIGTAHALRRDVFLQLAGYREPLFHQGEEMDYALRMLGAGFYVRLGQGDPIHHFESPRRDITRMSLFGRRNDILFAWHNVPMPQLLPHLAATTLNGLIHGFKVRRPFLMLRGLTRGYLACFQQPRQPVSSATYHLARRLKKSGPLRLDEIDM